MEQKFTEFRESGKSLKHELVSHMCLAGAVVASWSLTQEVAGSSPFTVIQLKVCSHLTFASTFASTSPSKFNIASMETQTQTHRMGLNPFLMFYIDVDANANVRCEHALTHLGKTYKGEWLTARHAIWIKV